ncbi:MAG: glycosyltransferase, partial [Candidatus Omnitrophica bacterium]|nr:glycosyltransferase [Candidatus Omnitrophota bacterium]
MKKIAIDTGPLKSGDSVRGIGVYTRELLRSLQEVKERDFKIESVDYFGNLEAVKSFDIIHFTRFNPFRISLPFKKPRGVKFVLTIYDLIPLIYHKHYPPGIKGFLNWQINKFLIKKNVDAIITISETSKKDICRFVGVAPDRIYVTYLAPRSIFRR